VRPRSLRNAKGDEAAVECTTRLIFTDPEAMAAGGADGPGVALLPMPFALPWLEQGALVRLLPGWYEDAGALSIYYPSRKLVPAKTRGSSTSSSPASRKPPSRAAWTRAEKRRERHPRTAALG
jgi:DNA-binding transcriptional LysR family regulator